MLSVTPNSNTDAHNGIGNQTLALYHTWRMILKPKEKKYQEISKPKHPMLEAFENAKNNDDVIAYQAFLDAKNELKSYAKLQDYIDTANLTASSKRTNLALSESKKYL